MSCSCNIEFSEFTPILYTQFNRIIVCIPLKVETNNNVTYYKAIVSKTYWGQNQDTVLLATSLRNGMCGLPLKLNLEYLIYGIEYENIISISGCSPSRKISNNFDEYINEKLKYDDSISLTINGIYKTYATTYVKEYIEIKNKQEIEYLELFSNTSNGFLITKFTNGKISGETSIRDGKMNGKAVFYYPNGKMKGCGNFENNNKVGIWKESEFIQIEGSSFYIIWKGNYVENKRRGLWKWKMKIGSPKEYQKITGNNLRNERNL
jgi:hypothetical protein